MLLLRMANFLAGETRVVNVSRIRFIERIRRIQNTGQWRYLSVTSLATYIKQTLRVARYAAPTSPPDCLARPDRDLVRDCRAIGVAMASVGTGGHRGHRLQRQSCARNCRHPSSTAIRSVRVLQSLRARAGNRRHVRIHGVLRRCFRAHAIAASRRCGPRRVLSESLSTRPSRASLIPR